MFISITTFRQSVKNCIYDRGNRLKAVRDAEQSSFGYNDRHTNSSVDDFEYDDYGNMIKNRDKEIVTISYNHLNLPVKVTFQGGETIEYTYLADGTKIKKTAKDTQNTTTTTEYREGFQYIDDVLEFFPFTSTSLSAGAEGYIKALPGSISNSQYSFHYVFTYRDHLGNIRLKYTKHPQTGEIQVLEEDHYYPYGLTHKGYQSNHQTIGFEEQVFTLVPVTPQIADPYKYKFNGMEWQDEFDINLYDFGARNYDPALGRWMNIDPLAELMRRHSPYNFAFNNPVYFIDPDGMMANSFNTIGMGTGSFESYDFTGSSSGFDVRTYDKATNETLDFKTVSSLDNVSYDSQSGAISTNNSSAYKSFFQGVSDYAANADVSLGGGCPEPCPWGTITERPTTWIDKWEESTNILAQTSYSIVNSFSIVFQSLNPFDNQVTTLNGEGLDGTDRSLYGAEVAASLLPFDAAVGLKYSTSYLKSATLNTSPTKQLFSLFRGKFRLERGVESIPRNIQRTNNIKLNSPVQKPWHFNINGKDIPVNPFNPLWRLYKK